MGTHKFSKTEGHAGLSDQVIRSNYPKCANMTSEYDDTMEGIDSSEDKAVNKLKKHQAPSK